MVEILTERGPCDGQAFKLPSLVAWLEIPVVNEYGAHRLLYRATGSVDLEGRHVYAFEGVVRGELEHV